MAPLPFTSGPRSDVLTPTTCQCDVRWKKQTRLRRPCTPRNWPLSRPAGQGKYPCLTLAAVKPAPPQSPPPFLSQLCLLVLHRVQFFRALLWIPIIPDQAVS
ncbi:hypothetical protein EJ04DRAFT_354391 [Polyplosphaeria fusca]|uniref:Uncharacterized protein n=1 Tax=Polyplosphaeria fusca TaxID=682080 RepID=A0A9P4R6V1_9PLEO|nr:hypothetical protein EJ04DRAFT_354391 [Polyplosphaeria fusca]